MASKYYITTAIAYASGKPHIGNTYEIVLADVLARFRRKQGYDVFFQTGTDEHGEKNQLKAEAAGVTPQQLVDRNSAEIKRIWDLMGTSYDRFIRTTEPYHKEQVAKIFDKFLKSGDIYKGEYSGLVLHAVRVLLDGEPARRRQVPRLRQRVKLAQRRGVLLPA